MSVTQWESVFLLRKKSGVRILSLAQDQGGLMSRSDEDVKKIEAIKVSIETATSSFTANNRQLTNTAAKELLMGLGELPALLQSLHDRIERAENSAAGSLLRQMVS